MKKLFYYLQLISYFINAKELSSKTFTQSAESKSYYLQQCLIVKDFQKIMSIVNRFYLRRGVFPYIKKYFIFLESELNNSSKNWLLVYILWNNLEQLICEYDQKLENSRKHSKKIKVRIDFNDIYWKNCVSK